MGKYLNISTGQLINETATPEKTPEEQQPTENNSNITSFENFEEADYKKVMAQQQEIKLMQKEFMIRRNKRLNIFLHVILCFVCQIVLVITIARYLITSNVSAFIEPVDLQTLFGRFICGTILHLSMLGEVQRGLANMKYVLNHSYMFESVQRAWVVGFL